MDVLWAELSKGLVPIILALIAGIGTAILTKLNRWLNGEKKTQTIGEAVVMAAVDPALTTGPAKLSAVTTALADAGVKATRAQIEHQVAKLVKAPAKKITITKECDAK